MSKTISFIFVNIMFKNTKRKKVDKLFCYDYEIPYFWSTNKLVDQFDH